MAEYQPMHDASQVVVRALNEAMSVQIDVQRSLITELCNAVNDHARRNSEGFDVAKVDVPDQLEVELLASVMTLRQQLDDIVKAAKPSQLKAAMRLVIKDETSTD